MGINLFQPDMGSEIIFEDLQIQLLYPEFLKWQYSFSQPLPRCPFNGFPLPDKIPKNSLCKHFSLILSRNGQANPSSHLEL
jgi:hypothetical protein